MSGVEVRLMTGVTEKLYAAAFNAGLDLMEHGLEEATRQAPIEEGTLIRSGHVSVDQANGIIQTSYDTAYAIRQHEDQSLRHDAGRKAKYLEDPMLQSVAPVAEEYIGAAIRKAAG